MSGRASGECFNKDYWLVPAVSTHGAMAGGGGCAKGLVRLWRDDGQFGVEVLDVAVLPVN